MSYAEAKARYAAQTPGEGSARQSCPPLRRLLRRVPAEPRSWRPRRRRWFPADRASHSPPPGSGPGPAGPLPATGPPETTPPGRSARFPESPAAHTGNEAYRVEATAQTAGMRRYCHGEKSGPGPRPPPDKTCFCRSRAPWAHRSPLPFGLSYHLFAFRASRKSTPPFTAPGLYGTIAF